MKTALTHAVIVIIIMVVSVDLAALAGAWAYHLELPGGKLAVYSPVFVLILYFAGLAFESAVNKKWRLLWILMPFFIVYPVIIFNSFSCKVETSYDYRTEDYKKLKSEHGKPMIRVNNNIYVPKSDYSEGLATRLEEIVDQRIETESGPQE